MSARRVLIPGEHHPIAIFPTGRRVVVRIGDQIIADTTDALTLTEAAYAPVQYISRKDADMAALARATQTTYCPYKGDCHYFHAPGPRGECAVWTYEDPFPAVAEIKDRLAFYPDRVTIEIL